MTREAPSWLIEGFLNSWGNYWFRLGIKPKGVLHINHRAVGVIDEATAERIRDGLVADEDGMLYGRFIAPTANGWIVLVAAESRVWGTTWHHREQAEKQAGADLDAIPGFAEVCA